MVDRTRVPSNTDGAENGDVADAASARRTGVLTCLQVVST